MSELENLVLLNIIPSLGAVRIKKLIDHFGNASNVISAKQNDFSIIKGIDNTIVADIIKYRASPDILKREFALIKKEKARICSINDCDYPTNLKEIYAPPPILYIKGKAFPAKPNYVALVGSRIATSYGQDICEKLSFELSLRGISVVSGLARGIDAAAHRGSLRAGGYTVAVLGSGFSYIYPRENRKLAMQITECGCLVSEFPISQHPSRENFPRRNRIISGLSKGIVVVEAAKKSGALITVNFALEQGREVFAVPGEIGSATSEGTHALIKDGAKLVENADDIINELNLEVENKKDIEFLENNLSVSA